jgi:hypothetical protein
MSFGSYIKIGEIQVLTLKLKESLAQQRLQSLLRYDPDTGHFFWLRPYGKARIGKPAGATNNLGYKWIQIDYRLYQTSRLVWLYVHGRWPRTLLDHINRDRADDRLINLREATYSESVYNRKMQSNNTSGYKGVWRSRGKWRAKIEAEGKRFNLGTFNSKEEAFAAYQIAAEKLHGEFAGPITKEN